MPLTMRKTKNEMVMAALASTRCLIVNVVRAMTVSSRIQAKNQGGNMKKKAISKIKVANHSEERIAELEESYACLRDSYLHIIKVVRIRTYVEKTVIISLFVGAAIMVILKVLGVL